MQIKLNFDPSVTWSNFNSNPNVGLLEEAAFKQAVERAATIYDNLFTNNVTITIDVGWGEINNHVIAANGASAYSHDNYETYSYKDVSQALINNAQSGTQISADATLPDPNSSPFTEMQVSTANAKALGLTIQNPPAVDGWIGFNTKKPWTFDLYDTPAGEQSLVAAAEHEISEVMGRTASVGTTKQHGVPLYRPIDLFGYSSPNVRDVTTGGKGSTAYFSIDNGVTDLGTWNNYPNGYDLGDWLPGPAPGGHDAYGGGGIGLTPRLTMTDLALMNVIGWNTNDLPNAVADGLTDWVPATQTHDGFHILSGGFQEVAGTTHDSFVDSGGLLQIDSGGQTSKTTLAGIENIRDGGTAYGTIVHSGGLELIKSGGSAVGAVLDAGGVQSVYGGGFVSGTVFGSGTQDLLSGAIVSGADIVSGTQNVSSGGTAVGTVLDRDGPFGDGVQNISAGGTASSTTISAGAQNVLSGGVASGTDVVSGNQYVSSGGVATDTLVGGFGYEWIKAGGSASGTTVSGGKLIMDGGSTASGAIIAWVGEAYVGGTTTATTISGGFEEVQSGGIAYGTVVSGGAFYVDSGGAASGTIVSSGDVSVGAGGLISGTILDGGNMVLRGTASGTTLDAATATFYDFGTDVAATISAGREFVESGGVASGTVVSAGMLIATSGGTASGTVLDQGVVQVLHGGMVDGATISGGTMIVMGAANGSTVDGGREIVVSGAIANASFIGDGILDVGSGGSVGGATPVTFTSGGDGTLRLDASSGFQPHFGPIAGFAGQDKIDLSDIAFGNQTTLGYQGNNMSGTLTVSDGVHAANLLLLGQYSVANFAIASDGHGGTLVTDPPLAQHPMLPHPQV